MPENIEEYDDAAFYRAVTEKMLREAAEAEARDKADVTGHLAQSTELEKNTAESRSQAEATTRLAEAPAQKPVSESKKGERLKEFTGAAFLFGPLGKIFSGIDLCDLKVFLDGYLCDAGNPTDPVERMLLEQLLLCHNSLGRIHLRAGGSLTVDEMATCHIAAARLQAEFRRTALALQTYKAVASKAPGAEHRVPSTARRPVKRKAKARSIAEKKAAKNELGSNNRLRGFFDAHEPEPEPALA